MNSGMSRIPTTHGKDSLWRAWLRDSATQARSHGLAGPVSVLLSLALSIAVASLTPVLGQSAQSTTRGTDAGRSTVDTQRALTSASGDDDNANNARPLNPHQKQTIMNANFEKAKNDAAELAAMAKELRETLSKPNVDVLSFEVVSRAEKISKLAKKIREETKAY